MRRKFTFVQSDANPCTTEDNILFKQTGFIHQNTSQSTQMTKTGTGKLQIGRCHSVADITYN